MYTYAVFACISISLAGGSPFALAHYNHLWGPSSSDLLKVTLGHIYYSVEKWRSTWYSISISFCRLLYIDMHSTRNPRATHQMGDGRIRIKGHRSFNTHGYLEACTDFSLPNCCLEIMVRQKHKTSTASPELGLLHQPPVSRDVNSWASAWGCSVSHLGFAEGTKCIYLKPLIDALLVEEMGAWKLTELLSVHILCEANATNSIFGRNNSLLISPSSQYPTNALIIQVNFFVASIFPPLCFELVSWQCINWFLGSTSTMINILSKAHDWYNARQAATDYCT